LTDSDNNTYLGVGCLAEGCEPAAQASSQMRADEAVHLQYEEFVIETDGAALKKWNALSEAAALMPHLMTVNSLDVQRARRREIHTRTFCSQHTAKHPLRATSAARFQ